MDTFDFHPSVKLAVQALQAFGFDAANTLALHKSVFDLFNWQATEYANQLRTATRDGQWFLMTKGSGGWQSMGGDLHYVAKSRESAVAWTKFLVNDFAVEVTDVKFAGERLEIFGKAGCLYAIEPVAFNRAFENKRERVQGVLKGLHQDDDARIAKSLSDLPGLSMLKATTGANSQKGSVISRTPNSYAKALHVAMIAAGIAGVKLHHAQEITAKCLGFANWQQLIARARKHIVMPVGVWGGQPKHSAYPLGLTVYRSEEEAVWGFGQRLKAEGDQSIAIRLAGCGLNGLHLDAYGAASGEADDHTNMARIAWVASVPQVNSERCRDLAAGIDDVEPSRLDTAVRDVFFARNSKPVKSTHSSMNLNSSPTIEQLAVLVAPCDDEAGHHVLWVDDSGYVHVERVPDHLTPPGLEGSRPTMKMRYPTLHEGGGYVGPDAAADESYLRSLLRDLVKGWGGTFRPGQVKYLDGSDM